MKKFSRHNNGLIEISLDMIEDHRGSFTKIFNDNAFHDIGINFTIKEIYYTKSKKNVIRGMHFQSPPMDHGKLIFLNQGKVIDVVVDLRPKTFGQITCFPLDAKQPKAIYIPKGFAHGFLSLDANSHMWYFLDSIYSPELDFGLDYRTIEFDWNKYMDNYPIVSERDLNHASLQKISEMKIFDGY